MSTFYIFSIRKDVVCHQFGKAGSQKVRLRPVKRGVSVSPLKISHQAYLQVLYHELKYWPYENFDPIRALNEKLESPKLF